MAPKIGRDEDGDIPPCSVLYEKKYAERWDAIKQAKYGGKQKAEPTVKRYWSKPKVPTYTMSTCVLKGTKFVDTSHLPKPSWWKRLLCFSWR
jgi:hypothetical protein